MRGVALHCNPDHVWVYMFLPKARNFLPVKRIDIVNPLFVMMPKALYLFSPPTGSPSSPVFQASHRILPPTEDLRTLKSLPTLEVQDARKDGEVTLVVHRDDIGILAPMVNNCVAVIAKDLETYVVIQLDQIAKLKKYLELPNEGEGSSADVDVTKLLYQ
jgi:hypothetical protein